MSAAVAPLWAIAAKTDKRSRRSLYAPAAYSYDDRDCQDATGCSPRAGRGVAPRGPQVVVVQGAAMVSLREHPAAKRAEMSV